MSSTNKTTNLELSQFLGSDSPKWLTDYNADMQKIDTAVGSVQSQANATDLVVSGHSNAIESLQTTTGEQGTAITQLRTDVNHNEGDINTINSLIGNGEPTTTDKTLIGSINELNANKLDSDDLSGYTYISDEIFAQVTGDGVKTLTELLDDLYNVIIANCANLGNDIIIPTMLALADKGSYIPANLEYTLSSGTTSYEEKFDYTNIWSDGFTIGSAFVRSSNNIANIITGSNGATSISYYNLGNDVITNGYNVNFYGKRYRPLP